MPSSLFRAALDAWQSGDPARALELCNAAVERNADEADAHRLLGEIHGAAGRVDRAIAACRQVAKLAPRDAANLRRLAVLLTQCRMPEAAAATLEASLELEPESARALNNLGSLLNELGRAGEAVPVLQRALAVQPDYAVAMTNLGTAFSGVGRMAEAIAHFDRAIALDASLAPAHFGRGRSLAAAGSGVDAIAAFGQAAQLNPKDPRVFMQMGHLMLKLGFSDNALSAFTAALELLPGDISALEGRVLAIMALKRHEEAIPAITALRAAAPWNHYLQGHQLHAQLQCADWSEFDASSRDIAVRILGGERVDLPLSFMAHNESPAEQLACARTFMRDQIPPDVRVLPRPARPSPSRLRIGYLSPDFRDHPVGQLIAGVIEAHDGTRFETHAFSTGPDDASGMRRRIEAGFDHFHQVANLSDLVVAERMAATVDIAVDLGGHTLASRSQLLAYRPAPVQLSFLGFPGTLGADFIDYIVGDRHVIPEADQVHYAEKVIYMPDSYLPGALPEDMVSPPPRIAAGLPATGFVYCSFNSPHKILPPVFDGWMRILSAVPDSVLWLRDCAGIVKRNLANEARARGVDPARLIYAPKVSTLADHIARLGLADLFLDTRPYNAHTTASDALAAGVPVLTMRGGSFASRVASSLLFACGLGSLSVATLQEYERLAVELARDPAESARLKTHLLRVRPTVPLFDTKRFCRHLETAYLEIWARHERGEPPAVLFIS